MKSPQRGRRPGALAIAVAAVGALWIFHLLCAEALGQETAAKPALEAVGEPPTTAPAVVVIETSPTAAAEVEGSVVPIETYATPQREIDESVPLNIFPDPVLARKILFGRQPFVYNAKARPDPMIIPWVRQEVIGNERFEQARVYLKEAEATADVQLKHTRYLQALEELDQIIKADPTSVLGRSAQGLAEQVRVAMSKLPPPGVVLTPTPTKPPELPPWIIANTRAVIYDASPLRDHMVLVGDDALRLNRVVPKFPDVKVVEITRDTVVYEYQKTRITVKIELDLTKP